MLVSNPDRLVQIHTLLHQACRRALSNSIVKRELLARSLDSMENMLKKSWDTFVYQNNMQFAVNTFNAVPVINALD